MYWKGHSRESPEWPFFFLVAMTDSIQDTLGALSEFLRAQGLVPHGGASEDEIVAFEQRYNVRLPADVRAYFARVNGVVGGRDGAWDDEMIALWELKDVRPLSEEVESCRTPEADRYLVFADWSIWAHAYAIHLDTTGTETPVYIVFNPQVERVADSFNDFLQRYVRRDPAVVFGTPSATA